MSHAYKMDPALTQPPPILQFINPPRANDHILFSRQNPDFNLHLPFVQTPCQLAIMKTTFTKIPKTETTEETTQEAHEVLTLPVEARVYATSILGRLPKKQLKANYRKNNSIYRIRVTMPGATYYSEPFVYASKIAETSITNIWPSKACLDNGKVEFMLSGDFPAEPNFSVWIGGIQGGTRKLNSHTMICTFNITIPTTQYHATLFVVTEDQTVETQVTLVDLSAQSPVTLTLTSIDDYQESNMVIFGFNS